MEYALKMASYGIINIQSFMNFCIDFQTMLRINPCNLRGCNIGIIDGRCMKNAPGMSSGLGYAYQYHKD